MSFRIALALIASLLYAKVWAASYKLDESHTQVGFKIKHLVISTVSGKFNKFSGTFRI